MAYVILWLHVYWMDRNESSTEASLSVGSSRRRFVDDGMVLDQACLLPSLAHYCLLAASTMPSTATCRSEYYNAYNKYTVILL